MPGAMSETHTQLEDMLALNSDHGNLCLLHAKDKTAASRIGVFVGKVLSQAQKVVADRTNKGRLA